MGVEKLAALPPAMQERLRPLLEKVEALTGQIKKLEGTIEQIARIEYPETKLLRQISWDRSWSGCIDRSDVRVDGGRQRAI